MATTPRTTRPTAGRALGPASARRRSGFPAQSSPRRSRRSSKARFPAGAGSGARETDGTINHRPGRDVTLSAPKSVSLMAMVGGDERIVDAHERAAGRTLARIEKNAVEARLRDPATGAMVRAGDQTLHGDLGNICQWQPKIAHFEVVPGNWTAG